MRKPPPKQAGSCNGPRRLAGEVLDIRTTAGMVGCTQSQVRARIRRGQLPAHRWGGRVIVLRSELLEYLASLPPA